MAGLKVIARLVAAPGAADEVEPSMRILVEEVRKEPGCIQYDLYRGDDEPDVFVFVEEWETRRDWEVHMEAPALKAHAGRIGEGRFVERQVHAMHQVA